MTETTRIIRRGVVGLLAASASCAVVAMPSAQAAPDPCSAANLTETISTVNHNISEYLLVHPETNQALSDVAKLSPFSAQSAFGNYFDAHTDAANDLRVLQQPLVDLKEQCGFGVTPGQVLGALGDL